MTGETVSAQDAERFGLVHACVPHDDLANRVDAVVAQLVLGGPDALLACKQLVGLVAFQAPEAVLDRTAALIADRRVSAEAQEGMVAFLTKRKANWIP